MSVRILTEAELRGLVPLDLAVIDAVAEGFRALARGAVVMPPILSMEIAEFSSILGAGTWFYLSKTWDPVNLQPKGGAKKADMNTLWWVIPGGLILSRVLSTFAGDQVTNFFIGVAAVWVLLTFGYMVAQAWRHHPQS
jgi:hypothetical protein